MRRPKVSRLKRKLIFSKYRVTNFTGTTTKVPDAERHFFHCANRSVSQSVAGAPFLNEQSDKVIQPAELRKRAEQEMQALSDEIIDPWLTDEKRLLHELQVHQIELEMQNETLHEALTQTEEACLALEREHQRYFELFDFAPIAYFKLEQNQLIRKANICAANLLGSDQSQLVDQDFSIYIPSAYRPVFHKFLSNIFLSGIRQSCELALQVGETQYWVTIEAIVDISKESCLMAVSDISGRKRNEELLRDNNAFIASILNSMNQQIAVLDSQGIILAVNNAWIEFGNENGLLIRHQNFLGSSYLEACKDNYGHFLCEDAHTACLGIQSVLTGQKKHFSLEYPCHSADEQRWFHMTVSSLHGPRYGAVVIHENITQRKQTERLPNILKAMFDISMDGFWELDSMGNILKVNERYAQISGYSVDELTTMNISQLDAIENNEQVKEHIAKVIAQGYERFETSHRHKDGHIIDLEIAAAFLPEFQQFCVFSRDISQRKQAQGKLNAIFNASVEGILSFDLFDRILSVNPAVENILGYTQEELIGRNISSIILSLPKCWNGCHSLGAIKQPNQIIESEGIHKNGARIPLELTRTEYTINNVCNFVVIIRDISLRKQREQQDKAHLDELAHITRLGLMGEMASGIAHEVNQPMSAISTYTQAGINLINSEKCDLAELGEILLKTQQQALRAGQIIHRMREFIRASPKQFSTIEINSLIVEATSLCSDDLKQQNINIVFGFENDLPPLSADHIQIEQVIINLIRNSIEVLQTLPKDQPRQISIQTQLTDDRHIQIRIKDNGPGMDLDQQRRILTPFYTTKQSGMGMGLAICRSLIEAHHGTLRFTSKPGKGTTFYFTLPLRNKYNGV